MNNSPPPLPPDPSAEPLGSDAREQTESRLRALVEAAIFVSPEPIPLPHLARALGEPEDRVDALVQELAAEYQRPERGLMIRKLAGGYQIITKPEHHAELKALVANLRPPAPLSMAALETVAVIAYKQPITAAEIQAIRSVQGSGVLATLLKRKLIAPAGRRNTPGKPLLYKTTRQFLFEFGLADLSELPSFDEFRQAQGIKLDS